MNQEWRDNLRHFLMMAGMQGRKEHEIHRRFSHVARDEVKMELEALWAEELVQRFTMSDPPHTVWRATTKMNV